MAACPQNAQAEIKNIPQIIHLEMEGGKGAVREFTDIIIKHNRTI